jgi:hypothetical protein
VLPSIFALIIGRKSPGSPSLYPGNPASAHFDPQLDEEANGSPHEGTHNGNAKEDDAAVAKS